MNALNQFIYNNALGVYVDPDYSQFSYTDGGEIEDNLLRSLLTVQDRSVGSEELVRYICDWPTEYHLSGERANLVRHLSFSPGDEILELGAGCGAITRYFGETGAKVTAVEGSLKRAACIQARCLDLNNVKIFAGNFQNIAFEKKYDVVTLIGVLEYAPIFFSSSDPILDCLLLAKQCLKPGGRLIIAIENRLGLKYFAGFSEDHTGIKYFGIEDRYNTKTAKTFGRSEIIKVISSAGFDCIDFSYPFPDYKLPTQIINQAALEVQCLNISDLLTKIKSRDYLDGGIKPNFDENKAWPSIEKNNLIGHLANSFLITCSDNLGVKNDDTLAISYQMTRRKEFCTKTRIYGSDEAGVKVAKDYAFPRGPSEAHGDLQLTILQSDYINGCLLSTKLIGAISNKDYKYFSGLCNLWLEYLFKFGVAKGSAAVLAAPISGDFIDCIPSNLIFSQNDSLEFIDREWVYHKTYSIEMLLIRGLYQLQIQYGYPEFLMNEGSIFKDFSLQWLGEIGAKLDKKIIWKFILAEDQIASLVYPNEQISPILKLKKNYNKTLLRSYLNSLNVKFRRVLRGRS